jgi:hypothetical protein
MLKTPFAAASLQLANGRLTAIAGVAERAVSPAVAARAKIAVLFFIRVPNCFFRTANFADVIDIQYRVDCISSRTFLKNRESHSTTRER